MLSAGLLHWLWSWRQYFAPKRRRTFRRVFSSEWSVYDVTSGSEQPLLCMLLCPIHGISVKAYFCRDPVCVCVSERRGGGGEGCFLVQNAICMSVMEDNVISISSIGIPGSEALYNNRLGLTEYRVLLNLWPYKRQQLVQSLDFI
jgi:hypothetical protein